MQSRTIGLISLGLMSGLVMLSGSGSGAAFAQSRAAAHEEVTVYAPYVVTRKVIDPRMSRKSSTGLELVSVSKNVTFHDLDLSKPEDVTMLHNRVRDAARDACSEIDKRFPTTTYHPIPENQDCVGNATNEAMITVKQLEAAAASN